MAIDVVVIYCSPWVNDVMIFACGDPGVGFGDDEMAATLNLVPWYCFFASDFGFGSGVRWDFV